MIELRHTDDTQAQYEEIYHSQGIRQMESYFIWLFSLLKMNQSQNLLDISTGEGQMVAVARRKGVDAYGLDFSFEACKKAYLISPGDIICADGHVIPFPSNSFNAVTCIGSLEHFEDMAKALREIQRILKPGGIACISVPNTFGIRWNVNVAWKTGDVDDDGQPLQRYGTRLQWERLLRSSGLSINKILGYEHERAIPRTWPDVMTYLKHPKRIFSRIFIVPFIPVNAAGQFVFLCEPTKG